MLLKGGGDAASAARAVIQTGEYDFAWNLQVEPAIIEDMMSGDNTTGVAKVTPGANVERIDFNFSDPGTEVNGQRSELNTPHPFLTDPAVRQAITTAVNRQQIADEFYGEGNPPASNILSGIPALESPNTDWTYDAEAAKQILEDAGWTGDGTRSKDDVELSVTYATSVNQVRQKTQAVVKANLEEIGFAIQLEQVDAGIFFDSSPGNDQSNTKMYTDMNMFTSGVGAPPPVAFMVRFYAGPNNEEIAQQENGWAGRNFLRWKNEEYDALYEQAQTESDPERQAELFIQMNDIVINENAVIPLVSPGNKQAYNRTINIDNIAVGPFEFDYWNIANWNRIEE